MGLAILAYLVLVLSFHILCNYSPLQIKDEKRYKIKPFVINPAFLGVLEYGIKVGCCGVLSIIVLCLGFWLSGTTLLTEIKCLITLYNLYVA